MPHVVTEPCFDCKDSTCVTVCPVDCFHEGERSLWIDPVECIDCGACIPECPVDAIFEVSKLPEKWNHYIDLNREQSKLFPVITEHKEPIKKSC